MDKMQVLEREMMVRWPWKDTRGPIKWSDLSEKTREYYKTAKCALELGHYPEDFEDHKLDFDHPDGPYRLVKEEDSEKEGFRSFHYEVKEELREDLEYPAIKHYFELRVPKDWLDPEKLQVAIAEAEERNNTWRKTRQKY
jgi:HEPN domain-containing protein